MKTTIKDICLRIWAFEKDSKPFDRKVRNVALWEILRFKLFQSLTIQNGIFTTFHPSKVLSRHTVKNRIEIIFRVCYRAIVHNPFICGYNKKAPITIIEHSRKQVLNGVNQDIYTAALKKNLVENKLKFTTLRRSSFDKPQKLERLEGEQALYLDCFTLIGRLSRITSKFSWLSSIDKRKIKEFGDLISVNFQEVPWNYVYYRSELVRFITLRLLYRALFKFLKTEKLYVVTSYTMPEAIAAAKDLNIEVIEIQHGIISKYHLGYSYPTEITSSNHKLCYFPDKLLTWGANWVLNCNFPIDEKNIDETYGWPHQGELKNESLYQKNPFAVTIISQGALGPAILNETIKILKFIPKHVEVYYKLHPSEIYSFDNYPLADVLRQDSRVEIIRESDLPSLLSRSTLVFGVFSTALLEAHEIGCEIWIFPLPGREFFEDIPWVQTTDNFESYVWFDNHRKDDLHNENFDSLISNAE